MAKKGGVANYNTFVQGLITEASPLTYPENASLDEANFELQRNGARYRRLGIDYENGATITNLMYAADVDDNVFMSFSWLSAGNSGGNDFAVVQSGYNITFFAMSSESISQNQANLTIDLRNYLAPNVTSAEVRRIPISVAQIKGNLVIASAGIDTLFVKYDPLFQTLSVSRINIQVRDFLGLDDGLEIEQRPGSLSAKHEYNLYNQGWNATNIAAYNTSTGVYPSNADIMALGKKADDTFDPTLIDLQFLGNTPAPKGHFIQSIAEKVYTNQSYSHSANPSSWVFDDVTNTLTISTPSAHSLSVGDEIKIKGATITISATIDGLGRVMTTRPEDDTLNNHYFKVIAVPNSTTINVVWVYDLSSQYIWTGRQYVAAKSLTITGGQITYSLPSDVIETITEDQRFSTVAGYAGRAWYSGIDSGQYSSHVFFSKILERPEYVGQCYQEADPTSEHVSDLVDTDGGFIVIPEMDRCVSLTPMGANLFVFANNGVWKISGIDGTFTATSYRVDKVSSVGVWGQHTIVPVETHIFYWAKGGIYMLEASEISQEFTAKNITQTSIQSLFNSFPDATKLYVKGTYDPTTKVIEWLINDDEDYGTEILAGTRTPSNYNTLLRFDTILGAWYKYEIVSGGQYYSGDKPFIADTVITPDIIPLVSSSDVWVGVDEVVVGTDSVIIQETTNRESVVQTKYLTCGSTHASGYHFLTFSNFKDSNFVDWYSDDNVGNDFESYLVTGYSLFDQQSLKKQAHYLIMYFERTESLLVGTDTGAYAINPSSCFVRVAWDWANSVNSGKWGSEFQAYRIPRLYYSAIPVDTYDYGEDVIVSKSKLRGRGRSFSLRIRSEAGKDMKLYGWSLVVTEQNKP